MPPLASLRAAPDSTLAEEDWPAPLAAVPEAAPPVVPAVADAECEGLRAPLVRAVRRICPRWLAAQADDIVQAALLRVLSVPDGRRLAPAYLWRAAYSATVDEIRRHRRRREVALEDALAGEASVMGAAAPAWDDPERLARAREIGRELVDCLRRLLEPRRLAVVLHLQGHTVPEAARILGWTDKRTENLVYRGLLDLRRCLIAKGLKP